MLIQYILPFLAACNIVFAGSCMSRQCASLNDDGPLPEVDPNGNAAQQGQVVHGVADPAQAHAVVNEQANEIPQVAAQAPAEPAVIRNTMRMICVGESPDLKLPILEDGLDPNTLSMQQLCAKPTSGSDGSGHHAGGCCINAFSGDIAFDGRATSGASSLLQVPRFLQACYYRCFCSDVQSSVQPAVARYRLRQQRPSYYDPLSTLALDDPDSSMSLPPWNGPGADVKSVRAVLTLIRDSFRFFEHHLGLEAENQITCRGDIPDFALPLPFDQRPPRSAQHLCATAWNGGSNDANAGGYCHRSDNGAKLVFFSDEATPRHDWTWAGGQFFAIAAIRFFCFQHCYCAGTNGYRKDNATDGLWEFIKGHELTALHGGGVGLRKTPGSSGQSSSQSPSGPGSKSNVDVASSTTLTLAAPGLAFGKCGADGSLPCPKTWDKAEYGPVPRAPYQAVPSESTSASVAQESVRPPSSQNAAAQTCGQTCSSASDCGTPETKKSATGSTELGCRCALPTDEVKRRLGLDPVSPVAICLSLFVSTMKGQRLHPRKLDDDAGSGRLATSAAANSTNTMDVLRANTTAPIFRDISGTQYTCRCNATYIADSCCLSSNGIVLST